MNGNLFPKTNITFTLDLPNSSIMTKTRLEAFSDGVLAIIITIMVLELKIPHEVSFQVLIDMIPVATCYLLSFIFIGIYWGNHHHLLHTVRCVNSKIIWANMGLLFFLSLIPFSTGWMGENHFQEITVLIYSINLLFCGIAFTILQAVIMAHHTQSSKMIRALTKQGYKGVLSLVFYTLAIASALFYPIISGIFIVFTSIMWLIPDKNIEAALEEE